MHANLEPLLATVNVIMAIALMGLMLVDSIKNECPQTKIARRVSHHWNYDS
jgi:hypothetical protein